MGCGGQALGPPSAASGHPPVQKRLNRHRSFPQGPSLKGPGGSSALLALDKRSSRRGGHSAELHTAAGSLGVSYPAGFPWQPLEAVKIIHPVITLKFARESAAGPDSAGKRWWAAPALPPWPPARSGAFFNASGF